MLDFVRGRIVRRAPDELVLESGGLGWRLLVSGATASRVPADGEVTLAVHPVIRDERPILYGFVDAEERHLFLRLTEVSRVGPTTALALLSALEPDALAAAVDTGDVAALARVKGVGKRTAERLCVELKGRLGGTGVAAGRGPVTDRHAALCAALVALGYPRAAADATARTVVSDAPADAGLERLVKLGLARLAGGARAESG